jgi:transcription-repair coupling factor (superfamily II helicase)
MGEPAQKRLQAILEATDLGAGFQISMRDLEIRGAGNLLGAEQSGHIAAVGFDLYTRLLAQAVEQLQTGKKPGAEEWLEARAGLRGPAPVTLDLPLQAYLPVDYVPDPEVRLQVYRHMAEVRTSRQVQEMVRELRDRFGEPPPPAQLLVDLLRLKVLALRAGATEVRADGRQIAITLAGEVRPDLSDLPPWVQQRLRTRANLAWLDRQGLGERWVEVLRRVLLALAGAQGEDDR